MKSLNLKYRTVSLLVLLAILPSILGVHVFQHHCFGCDGDETITRIITTAHSHEHACSDCSCEKACESCAEISGKHVHHHSDDGTCKHEFKKASFEGQTAVVKLNLQPATLELLASANLFVGLTSIDIPSIINYSDVIQKIPDEPSPEENCVFLL